MIYHIKESIDQLLNALGTHPIFGFSLSIFHLVAGIVLQIEGNNILSNVNSPHPLQVGAWIISILVGVLTIIGFIKNHTTLLDNITWIKKLKNLKKKNG